MSPTTYDDALDFMPTKAERRKSTVLVTLATYLGALRDGIAASHHYEELRGRGVAHADAAATAFRQIDTRR